jgi:hypothetical protein
MASLVIVVDVGKQVIVDCMAYRWPVGDILSFATTIAITSASSCSLHRRPH